jgi:hypothetical protein
MVHLKRILIGGGMMFITFAILIIFASVPDMISLFPMIGLGILAIVGIVISYAIGYGMTT